MERQRHRLVALVTLLMMAGTALAQSGDKTPLNLKVTVEVEKAGSLFVEVQAKIEELGELSDIAELTVTGHLNIDDNNVIHHQMTNLTTLDLGEAEYDDNSIDFSNMEKLQHVVLPKNLKTIPSSCLMHSQVTDITIPETVTTIEGNAFSDTPLKSITLPEGLTYLGPMAFSDCTQLTSITLPDALTTIEMGTFQGCTSLAQITLPANLTEIRSSAFAGTGFTSFTLPAGVKITEDLTFADCKQLTSITFPDGLTNGQEIGTSTLSGCSKLTTVRLPQDLTEIPYGFFAATPITSLLLTPSVTSIGMYAYWGTTALKNVTLPEQLTSIGREAFEESAVEQVVWPATVTTIGRSMFQSCKQLESITIPETVNVIEDGAFDNCEKLKSIHLPEGLTEITFHLFNKCPLETVNIPTTVKKIGANAFNGCRFTSITLPEGLTHIDIGAFEGVPLETLSLPSQLKTIGARAFFGGAYTEVVVPEGVVSIAEKAFCTSGLQKLDLPSTMVVFGGHLLGDSWDAIPCQNVILRATTPPFTTDHLLYEYTTGGYVLKVPAASLQLYQRHKRYDNLSTTVEALPDYESPNVLNVTEGMVLQQGDAILEKKMDVNFVETYLQQEALNYLCNSAHPYLTLGEGATARWGTVTMTCDPEDVRGWTQHTWPALLNKGTATADLIDVRWKTDDTQCLTPAFDINVSDIVAEREGAPFAFFRYDAAARAVGNMDGAWVRMKNGDVLKAGQGYLLMAERVVTGRRDDQGYAATEYPYIHLRSHQDGKNYFLGTDDVTLPLVHASGEFTHNKNWNLVGQPFPAFLDIRAIDYDGPIMRHTGGYGGWWEAYSPLDDEVVLNPMEPFFVQVPDGISSITLDADRRQLGNEFVKGNEPNNSRALRRADKNSQREVFNITLTDASSDATMKSVRTRLVINPEATTRYDIGRDAPMMAANGSTLLYTQAAGVAYAINERPLDDGLVRLGMQLAKGGTYRLALSRKDGAAVSDVVADIYLYDQETGLRTLLLAADGTSGEAYEFSVGDGATLSSRFVIAIGDADPTSITDVEVAQPVGIDVFYNLAGQRISAPQQGVYIYHGKKLIK